MKKFIIQLLTLILVLPFLPQVYGESPPVQIIFDYSRYMPAKAWDAIHSSQGAISYIVPTFDEPSHVLTQGVVLDAEKGLILTVNHGLSDFPDIVRGEHTVYLFTFQGTPYPLQLLYISPPSDLAIFKIKSGDLSKLKSVKFTKDIETLKRRYYAFRTDVELDIAEKKVRVAGELPWRAYLIGCIRNNEIEELYFDKSIMQGFSGSGVFNNQGEVVGIIRLLDVGGTSRAVSVNTINIFIERSMGMMKKGEQKRAGQQKAKTSVLSVPQDPNKK